jgi:hypothetical protein
MKIGCLKAVCLFFLVCLIYSAWMTGFSFKFSESKMFPNYNMLAEAFVKGHLFIETSLPQVDIIIKDGKQYFYSGPVPALLRVPFIIIAQKSISTGVMIVLFCAGISTLFAMILGELTPPGEGGSLSLVKIILVMTFIFNGFSLFMVTIPTFHNEAISAAMFFLLAALYFFLKIRNQGYRMSAGTSIFIGLSLVLCIGSRISYVWLDEKFGPYSEAGNRPCFCSDRRDRRCVSRPDHVV